MAKTGKFDDNASIPRNAGDMTDAVADRQNTEKPTAAEAAKAIKDFDSQPTKDFIEAKERRDRLQKEIREIERRFNLPPEK